MIINMQSGGVIPERILDAQNITPSTEDQVITEGTYLRGKLTVAGDPDLIAENIAYGKDIFGIIGKYGGIPIAFSYSGESQISFDETEFEGASVLCFTLKLLSSGTLNIKSLGTKYTDIYVIGGGGSGAGMDTGSNSLCGGGGGGGGYLTRNMNTDIPLNTPIEVIIGAGGVGSTAFVGVNGGVSSILGVTANGGNGGNIYNGGDGGSGGGAGSGYYNGKPGKGDGKDKFVLGTLYCGGGGGAYNNGNSGDGGYNGGDGYEANIRNELNGTLGGGGTQYSYYGVGEDGIANTGGGGAGATAYGNFDHIGGDGGSGIVIIRGRYN